MSQASRRFDISALSDFEIFNQIEAHLNMGDKVDVFIEDPTGLNPEYLEQLSRRAILTLIMPLQDCTNGQRELPNFAKVLKRVKLQLVEIFPARLNALGRKF